MAHKIQFRRDTAQRWSEVNSVLMEGEIGIETDTHKAKVGNGVDNWNILPYIRVDQNGYVLF